MTMLPTIVIVISVLLLLVAFVLTIKPWWVAAVPAWLAMVLLYFGNVLQPATLPVWKLVMWTFATMIVVALRRYQPQGEPDGRNTGNLYVGLSAIVGVLLGIMMGQSYVLLGTIVGAMVGAMAYSRTPHGKWIRFAKSTFIQYFCARCLPAIVAVAMAGICLEAILFNIRTSFFYTGI